MTASLAPGAEFPASTSCLPPRSLGGEREARPAMGLGRRHAGRRLLIVAGAFALKWSGRSAARCRTGADQRAASGVRGAVGGEPGAHHRNRTHGLPSQAIAADLAWARYSRRSTGVLPPETILTGFDVAVGGAPQGEDPATEAGLVGTISLESPTPDRYRRDHPVAARRGSRARRGRKSVTSSKPRRGSVRVRTGREIRSDDLLGRVRRRRRRRRLMPKQLDDRDRPRHVAGRHRSGFVPRRAAALPAGGHAWTRRRQPSRPRTRSTRHRSTDFGRGREPRRDQRRRRRTSRATARYGSTRRRVRSRRARGRSIRCSLTTVTAGEQVAFAARTGVHGRRRRGACARGHHRPDAEGTDAEGRIPAGGSPAERCRRHGGGCRTTAGRLHDPGDCADMGQVIAFLDALRAGPRLLSNVTANSAPRRRGHDRDTGRGTDLSDAEG